MAVMRLKAAGQPCELAFQLIAQRLWHSLKQKRLGSLANGKPNGRLERTPVFVPELGLVAIHAIEHPKASLQLVDGQRFLRPGNAMGAGGGAGRGRVATP